MNHSNHWSVDISELKKNPTRYAVWRLEHAINYGLRDSKLSEAMLREYWDKIDIDPAKRKFLSLLLAS